MTDTWTATPFVDGVVLMGDAAGWSNPVTGQSLAVALRDANVFTRLLLDNDGWDIEMLEAYATERKARMDALIRQQPDMVEAIAAVHVGPWRVAPTSSSRASHGLGARLTAGVALV